MLDKREKSLGEKYIPRNERHPEQEGRDVREERDLYEKYVSGQRLTVRERLIIHLDQGPTMCHWFSWCWQKPLIIGLPLALLGIALLPIFLFVCDLGIALCVLLMSWSKD